MSAALGGHQAGLPERQVLEALFRQKYGPVETVGWSPSQRWRFGYFLPADVYEVLVAGLIGDGCRWLDIGGGHQIFPTNPALATELVSKCARVVAVDPSDNVVENGFVHETVRGVLEDYTPDEPFDVATMRMVAEHVERPQEFVRALGRVVRPGGRAVVFTVNAMAPVTIISRILPFGLHHKIKEVFWGGDSKDTFPTCYRMNSRRRLKRLLSEGGFEEERFLVVDDLSVFGRFRGLSLVELHVRRLFRGLGLPYPENVLIGIYRKRVR